MNEEICCITNKENGKMNGKMITLTFFELYTVYIKNQNNSFFILLVKLFKQRYISVKRYKYLNNKLNIKTEMLTF